MSLAPWAHHYRTMVLFVMKMERKGIGLWSLWRHKSPRTHQSSAFSKPDDCLWPLTSAVFGIKGMYLDLVHYRKSVSSLQLLAWCTVKIFFSNGKNKPLHFSYVKLQILELWNEILQVTFHMSCHLLGALARTLEPRSCSKIQHLWKLTLSIFQFYLNFPCLFYTIADKVDSTNSAPIS